MRLLLALVLMQAPAQVAAFGFKLGISGVVKEKGRQVSAQTQGVRERRHSETRVFATAPAAAVAGPRGTVPLSVYPVSLDKVLRIDPPGHLNPPGHTFPTGNVYSITDNSLLNFYAPADGTLVQATLVASGQPGKYAIIIKHTETFRTYFQGISELEPSLLAEAEKCGLKAGVYENCAITVKAGQLLGAGRGLEWGLQNLELTQPFVNPANNDAHADSPFKYFTEPVRSLVYGKIQRRDDLKDGRVAFDAAGSLAGNWLLKGTHKDDFYGHLSFVRSETEPELTVICLGSKYMLPVQNNMGYIAAAAPLPEAVTPASGKVAYQILAERPGSPSQLVKGLLIVEMLAVDRIRAEVFPGSQALTADFTANSGVYIR